MINSILKNPKETIRYLVVVALISILCFLIYYFEIVLKTHIIYSHLFYFPIILACYWWKKKGLIVPLFLSGILILFYFLGGGTVIVIIEGFERSIIFTIVGLSVSILSQIISKNERYLRESEEKLTAFMESATDGFVIYDKELNLLEVNNPGLKILGMSKENMIGKYILEISPDLEKIGRYDNYLKVIKTGQPFHIDELIPHPNFGDIHISVSAFKVGEGLGIIFSDITKRKKAEEALKESEESLKILNEELEQKVEKRTKNLKLTMEDLKRSNAELEQFAYVASHDLQEPLRMVASFTQLLQNRYKDKLDEDANDFINFAVDGATRMQNLISDLLMFSRVGTRGKPFKNTDMNAVLEGVIATFRQLIKETNVTLTYKPLPMILADESQMIQLLQNLISNAIKFHKEEEPSVVHISAKLQKNQWIISVRDNGIGIDSQFFDRIFIIFQRLHKKSEYEGTGIGLAICKKIIQRHGGKIWVESELGKGSTFYFSIPKTEVRK